jgi:hypothetical protein
MGILSSKEVWGAAIVINYTLYGAYYKMTPKECDVSEQSEAAEAVTTQRKKKS